MDSKKLLQLFSKSLFALIFFAMMGFQTATAQTTIFVSSTTGSDAFNGQSATVSGGNGPKASLTGANGALSIATDGDTISIEAGAYGEAFEFTSGGTLSGDMSLSVVVRSAGAVTVATFSGTATVDPGDGETVSLNSGTGSVGVSGASLTLDSGTFALGTGKLAMTADPTAVFVTAGVASGASPSYAGEVNVDYSIGDDLTAGTELPANMDGGTLSVTSAAGDDLTIGSGFLAADIDASLAGGDVSITGDVTLSAGLDASGAGDVSLTGDLDVTGGGVFNGAGDLAVSGDADVVGGVDNDDTASFGSLEANDDLVDNSGTLTVTGALTFDTTTAAGGADPAVTNTGTMTVGSLSATTDSDDDDVADVTTRVIDNDDTFTVSGATSGAEVDDEDNTTADVVDRVGFDLDNADAATFTGGGELVGVLNGAAGTVTFGANVDVFGSVDNSAGGDIALGSWMLDASLDGGPGHDFGSVTGSGSTVTVSGDTDVAGISTEGDLALTGDGDIAGASTVEGDFSASGDNDLVAALTVEGDASFSGTHVDTAGGHDVDGAATVSGSLDITGGGGTVGSMAITSTGSLTMDGATLVVEGDFDSSQGGAFSANGGGSFLDFDLGANSTFSVGPNTTIDMVNVSGAFTQTMTQSIAVDEGYEVETGATVDLGDFLIRETGGSEVLVDGNLTTDSGTDGALAFEATGADLDGLGSISNILVNIAGGGDVIVGSNQATEIDFTGTLTLFDGGIDISAAFANDISPSGAEATVSRNLAGTGTDITGTTFNDDDNDYILTVFGGVAGTAASELAVTGVSTLNINGAGTSYDTDGAGATVGNVNVATGAELDLATSGDDIEIEGILTNAGSVTGAVGDVVTLSGASTTHSNTGDITADVLVLNTGITINGTTDDSFAASLGNLTVGDGAATTATGSATLSNIQEIDGDVMVDGDGSLTIGLAGDDGDAATVGSGDEGTIDGMLTVADDGSVTLSTDVEMDGTDTVTLGESTLNFGGNTLTLSAAPDFNADSNTTFDTSGALEFDAIGAVGTNEDGGTSASTLPGLVVNADVTLSSDTSVDGTIDVNDTASVFGADDFMIAGTVTLDATTSGVIDVPTIITGTTVTLESDYMFVSGLEIDATSVTIQSDDLTTPTEYTMTVDGGFTHTAGAVTLNSADVDLDSGVFDWTAGTWTATNSTDQVRFDGATLDTNDGTLMLPNVDIDTAITVGSDDTLTITANLELSDDLDIDGTASAGGTVNLGNGGTLNILANGGNVDDGDDADATVAFAGTTNVEYDGTGTTGDELPDTVNTLTISDAVSLEDTAAREANITVTTLNLDAAGFDIDPGADNGTSVTIADAGAVVASVDGPFVNDTFALAGTYNLTYDGAATVTGGTWVGTPASTTIDTDIDLSGDEATVDFTVNAGDTFDLLGSTLNVTGGLTNNGTITDTGVGGSLAFSGSTPQTITGGLSGHGVTIANDVTLVGGDLDLSGAGALGTGAGFDLILTSGVLTTGSNNVILDHDNTADQGFTQTDGVIFGNVQKNIDFDTTPTSPNRVAFPTGASDGNDRGFAITFNDVTQLGADVLLTVGFNEANAGGLNGFPITAQDDLGANFEISRYVTDFHWAVESAPSITPSIDYDVEYRAAGFAGFDGEDIEKTRAIRRQDGNMANFWIKVANGASDNDNFAVSATEPVMVARNAVGAINVDAVLFTIGLEDNLSATDPAALTLNAGNTEDIDLTTVFSGGSPGYTYAVTDNDDTVASGAAAADVLTVTGVAAGSTTITVVATDSFGSTSTATVTVTVNAAFAAGTDLADLAAVNVGAADATVDGSVAHAGGTSPVTYAVTSSDGAVATATVDAAGVITIVYGGVGTSTIELTATDAEGDTVVDSFDVTVNAAASAGGTLTNQSVNNGATVDQDVSGEFSGGTGGFTYTAASGDATVATAAVSGSTVTTTGVSPYVVVAGAVTADAAPATITVTATDDLGSTVSSTYDVEVNPVLGNVDGSGGVSPASASLALDAFLGLTTLTAKQTTAADYNTDASVTPFDAALIFDAWLNPTPGAASKKEFAANPASDVAFGELNMQVTKVTIPVTLTGDQAAAVSFSFETSINAELASVTGVTGTVEGWTVRHFVGEDGTLRIAGFGLDAIPSDGIVANISLELLDAGAEFTLRGQGAVNNNPATDIEGIDVVELPENFALLGNYPNPFNPSTNISFDLPASADVSIEVYDMLGRRVMVLPMQTMQAGSKRSVQLNASQLASGSYFYRVIAQMESKTQVDNGRMLLIK